MPSCLIGQIPLQTTLEDFWQLVWQEKVELVCSIATPYEVIRNGVPDWIPKEKGEDLIFRGINCRIQLTNIENINSARKSSINLINGNIIRSLTIIEITDWNEHSNLEPRTLATLLSKIGNRFHVQKSNQIPPLIISPSGSSRCGALLFGLLLMMSGECNEILGSESIHRIYINLQKQRNLLIQGRHTTAVINSFNVYNSCIN
jgi:protein tyrosine phosphatase